KFKVSFDNSLGAGGILSIFEMFSPSVVHWVTNVLPSNIGIIVMAGAGGIAARLSSELNIISMTAPTTTYRLRAVIIRWLGLRFLRTGLFAPNFSNSVRIAGNKPPVRAA